MSARREIALSLLVASVLLVVGAASTWSRASDAAFTTQRSNPANQFSAATSFERMRIGSGTYTGNGLDNRNIAGAGFQPDLVIVKGNTAQTAVARSVTMTGDSSKPLGGAAANAANMVQALQPDGFQVGTQARVNSSGVSYSWVAIAKAQGTMGIGSYTGNGAASRSISGLGHSPEAVIVFGATAVAPALRIAGMSTGFAFDTGTGIANSITALGGDGFTVGNNAATNTSGVAYHYVSWSETPELVDAGSYTGDGTASRNIASSAVEPALALVRSSSTTSSRAGVWRPSALTGTSSLRFNAATNNTNAITGLQTAGFQVGANADTNASAIPYTYLALADESP